MTLSVQAIWLYAGALAAIWLTPGPVWVAIMARGLSSGWAGVWPLALGVAIGDMIWPLIAIFGLTLLVGDQAALLSVLRWIAVAVFLGMGIGLLRHAGQAVDSDSRLTRRGGWAGFSAGLLASLFFFGAIGLLLLFIAMLTHTGGDAAWSTSGDGGPVRNAVGVLGAWVSDLLFFFFALLHVIKHTLCCRMWRSYFRLFHLCNHVFTRF